MNRYADVTLVSRNEVVSVSLGTDDAAGRRPVILHSFKDHGLQYGLKEEKVLMKLARSRFVVNLVERIDLPAKKRPKRDESGDPRLILVLEALDLDLATYLTRHRQGLPVEEVRSFAMQLLMGLEDVHNGQIYVRDLRPANIRLAEEELAIRMSDFTASKVLGVIGNDECTPPKDLRIEDLRYQAPEVLIAPGIGKVKSYDSSVDLWSVGCIIVEMTIGKVPFDAKPVEPFYQLMAVLSVLGTPSTNPWPNVLREATWKKVVEGFHRKKFGQNRAWKEIADSLKKKLGPHGLDLVQELLTLDPKERITATAAMKHRFFDVNDGIV